MALLFVVRTAHFFCPVFRTFKKRFSFSPFLYLPTPDLDVDPKGRKNLITNFIKITGGSEEVNWKLYKGMEVILGKVDIDRYLD
jgi:hypothetical protein